MPWIFLDLIMQLRLEVILDIQDLNSKAGKITLSQITTFIDIVQSREFNENHKPLCDNFYEIPTSKSKRKAAFGYGKKSDFTSGKFLTPAPSKYDLKTEIETKIAKK